MWACCMPSLRELWRLRDSWSGHWCLGGDFNEVMEPTDRNCGGSLSRNMLTFSNFIDSLSLQIIPFFPLRWRMLYFLFLTLNHLQSRGWNLTNRCILYRVEEESVSHLLIHCPVATRCGIFSFLTYESHGLFHCTSMTLFRASGWVSLWICLRIFGMLYQGLVGDCGRRGTA